MLRTPKRGLGRAYIDAIHYIRGQWIVMGDADLTYDFCEIPRFVKELDEGAELVMGNRLNDVQPGAMSILSRIGNPILSGFLNFLFHTPVGDAHCGMRALRRDILPTLGLQATGMARLRHKFIYSFANYFAFAAAICLGQRIERAMFSLRQINLSPHHDV